MDNMEQSARSFLKRVLYSIFLTLAWLFLNMTIGIYFGWLFIYDSIRTGNVVYYCFLGISFVFLLRTLIKLWKKKFPHG